MPLHIPEAELHAYLDQALPRSRCVTLESHLAGCDGCRARRDDIAALRDQTTLLLARLAPERRRIPPSLEELERRVAARRTLPAVRWRRVAWAASLVGAVALGYTARTIPRGDGNPPDAAEAAPVVGAGLRPSTGPSTDRTPQPRLASGARPVARPASAAATSIPATFVEPARTPSPSAIELSSGELPSESPPPLDGIWRSVPWEQAAGDAGDEPARVSGVPVVEVQVQPGQQAGQALTVVAQQLQSGELITTIEGPVEDVWALLSRRGDAGDTAGAEAMRRGERLLAVTGQLPPDSLRAMVRRVNAAQRVR